MQQLGRRALMQSDAKLPLDPSLRIDATPWYHIFPVKFGTRRQSGGHRDLLLFRQAGRGPIHDRVNELGSWHQTVPLVLGSAPATRSVGPGHVIALALSLPESANTALEVSGFDEPNLSVHEFRQFASFS
jgi:hypothetical protein